MPDDAGLELLRLLAVVEQELQATRETLAKLKRSEVEWQLVNYQYQQLQIAEECFNAAIAAHNAQQYHERDTLRVRGEHHLIRFFGGWSRFEDELN